MCNLYTQTRSVDEVARIFRDLQIPLVFPDGPPKLAPRDIAITDPGPIVRASADASKYELVVRRWSWPGPGGKPVYNFRSDGREFSSGRCLIVADGFYEWRPAVGAAETKQPFHITRVDGEAFAFAGLWSTWRSESLTVRSCAILTAEANAAVAPLHDRMPVILDRDAEEEWLDPHTPRPRLIQLLAPLAVTETALRPVGPAVNDARYDGPECLEAALDAQARAEAPAAVQPTLF